jgi:hypothetical protein
MNGRRLATQLAQGHGLLADRVVPQRPFTGITSLTR